MIYIDNRQDKIPVTTELIKSLEDIIAFTLKEEGVAISYEVSVVLVDNCNIKDRFLSQIDMSNYISIINITRKKKNDNMNSL